MTRIKDRLLDSRLFKDSFWSLIGNVGGNASLLVAGILIARFLGKDLYGEYGLVKTNMFYMAGFSTFGLVYTSTKYVAQYLRQDPNRIKSIIQIAVGITTLFSLIIACLIVAFSTPLSVFLGQPDLSPVLRVLSFIVVLKALSSTGIGVLAGLGEFKILARNNILSGLLMLSLCMPLTFYHGLFGAFTSLSISQLFSVIINFHSIKNSVSGLPFIHVIGLRKEMLSFSFPVALQEVSYAICNWGAILLLTKMSSLGELGLYSATAQWNSVILFIPGVLANVVLSHLSRTNQEQRRHGNILKTMFCVYLCCSLLPFVLVIVFSRFIVSLYGTDFQGMLPVLRIVLLATIPICCSDVFKSEFISTGHTWLLFIIRFLKDALMLFGVWIVLYKTGGGNGAEKFAIINVIVSFSFFSMLLFSYLRIRKDASRKLMSSSNDTRQNSN